MATTQMHRVDTVVTGPPGAPFYMRHFIDAAASTPVQAATAVRVFLDAIKGVVDDLCVFTVQSQVFQVDPVTGQNVGVTDIAALTPVTGTASDEALPFANQGILTWSTAVFRNGRRVRGRTFIPGMTQAANNGGVTIPAYRTTIQGAAANLATAGHVVYSPTAHEWFESVEWVVAPKIGVLRSRRD